MKYLFLKLTLLFALFGNVISAQHSFVFEYGDMLMHEAPACIVQNTNGNFYAGIYKGRNNENEIKSLLLRVSDSGSLISAKAFENRRLLNITNVGSNLLCYGYNELQDSISLFFTVLNTDLDVVTDKNYELPGYNEEISIARSRFTKDSNKIHCLFTVYHTTDFIMTVNETADSLSSVLLNDSFKYICRNPSTSGFIMTGYAEQGEVPPIEASFTDSVFNVYKEVGIDVSPGLYSTRAFVEPLNGKIVFSSVEEYYDLNDKISIAVFDTTMTLQAHTTIGPDEFHNNFAFKNGLLRDGNNNLYVFQTINNRGGMPYQLYDNQLMLSKFDASLNEVWSKFYGGDAFYQAYDFSLCSDGGVVMAAVRYDHEVSNFLDLYIIKTDSEGNVDPNTTEEAGLNASELILYPNPGNAELNVRTAVQALGGEFILYDTNGKLLQQCTINRREQEINTSKIPIGQYIWKYQKPDGTQESGVWIKQ